MAKSYKHLLLLLLTAWLLSLTACQEGSEAGDLFGQWQLSESEYLSFSGAISVFRTTHQVGRQIFGNFQHTGDSLFIQCFSKEGERLDTLIVEETFGMRPFNNIRLKIESLNDDHLVVSKDGRTWNLKKY